MVFAAIALVLCAAAPIAAQARDYTMGPVTIDATLEPDGTLSVTEDRTFEFDGEFNGVYWRLPAGVYEGRDIRPVLEDCGVVAPGGRLERFTDKNAGLQGSYELSEYGDYTEVKLYNPVEDEGVTYRVSYRLPGLATAWHDTGELYWKFVSDGWDVRSNDVTCTVHLPVPAGETVEPGKNVRAWGHGTLDGEVAFHGDDVTFTVPAVGTNEFAEARIAFPVSWLTTAPRSEERLGTILAEEQRWADEANEKRAAVRTAIGIGTGAVVLVPVGAILASAIALVCYKRSHRPQFQGPYFRDVPSADHPAVLGALYHNGKVGTPELTATLMRVSDLGAVELARGHVPDKHSSGKGKEDYQLVRNPRKAEALESPVDRQLMEMLFDKLAPLSKRYVYAPDGRTRLDFSQLKKVAKKHPERYMDAYTDWKAMVEGMATARGFFTDAAGTGLGWPIVGIVLSAFAFVGCVFMGIVIEPVWYYWLLLLLPIAAVAVCVLALLQLRALSAEAVELRAQLEALRRWLKDFTRLNEAVPTDVVLWNRLLVMAVVLGVADEVVKQLRVAVPQVLEDETFMHTYMWYYGYGSMRSPVEEFSRAMESSYQASASALAESAASSGGGGGGGFSGGGGGGFGGGGGGGAF